MADYDPNEEVNLVLLFPHDRRINFKALKGTIVKGLKLSIDQARIIQESEYYFTFEDKILHNDWILGKVGVKDGSELVINQRKEISIVVQHERSEYTLSLTEDVLISDLKTTLASYFGVDENQFTLKFGDVECEDDKTVKESGITNTSVIFAVAKN